MWNPFESFNQINPTEGVIRLWHTPNYFDSAKWTTNGVFGEDLYYYFFIPYGFSYVTIDTFQYDFGFKYVNKEVEVTGFVNHNGPRELQEGKTKPFWHLEENQPELATIITDPEIKLPYLIVPDVGDPHYVREKRYFIPLGINC